MKSILLVLIALYLTTGPLTGQVPELYQTLRGTIVDSDSKIPLAGVNVIIDGSDPIKGTTTDTDGVFRFEKMPLGRVSIRISYLGYNSRLIPNIILTAGKEVVLDLQLQESVTSLENITVTANSGQGEPVNEMALVSGRSISTEEMNRMTTSFNDPALITANFAGVANSGNGGNDIIIRGNSPKYMQWRLEGMPITNPNHFADQNSVSGSTSTLNSNLLATSDFHTGAFAPEFGDVLAGIYDVKLRNGNNEQQETIIGVGLIGTDLTVEGPFKKGYQGSYLANYRYSTSSMLTDLGLLEVEGSPKFQDAAFKINLPTGNLGTFSIYGLGGLSEFSLKDVTPKDWDTPGDEIMNGNFRENYDKSSFLANAGLKHLYPLNRNSFLETAFSLAMDGGKDQVTRLYENESLPGFESDLKQAAYRGQITYHNKLNHRNRIQAGTIYTLNSFSLRQNRLLTGDTQISPVLDFDQQIGNLRNYISWKHQLNQKVDVLAGLHNTNVLFNGTSTFEPRLATRWQFSPRSSINFGYGLHSTMERVHHYYARIRQEDGTFNQPNQNLDLLKAHHLVLGYDFRFKPEMLARIEVYYQHLFDLPVENNDTSYFSTLNEGLEFHYVDLVNAGTGRNYGIELTLQRFFSQNFYYLFNASLYESKYTPLDGIERNTRFNGNYLLNFLVGKEYPFLGRKKNRTLAVNARFFMGGGKKIIPLLRDSGGNLAVDPANNRYWEYNRAYQQGLDNLYQLTLSASYKIDKPKATHEWLLNLENVTNRQGRLTEYYDPGQTKGIGYTTQFGLLPNLMYKLYF